LTSYQRINASTLLRQGFGGQANQRINLNKSQVQDQVQVQKRLLDLFPINPSTHQRINPPSPRLRRAGASTLTNDKCKIKYKFRKGYWIYFQSTHQHINASTILRQGFGGQAHQP